MTPDEIQAARELAELCLSLETEGKANVTEVTFARYALRALDALEASLRECEELRAEVEGLKASCYHGNVYCPKCTLDAAKSGCLEVAP